jgi:hypothetical protein
MGNYIETIDDIVMESEIEILMKMGDMYQKQLIMESYYMEEETPKTEKDGDIGEVPKVDDVGALTKFINWIKRCMLVIRTKIRMHFSNKKIKDMKEYIDHTNVDSFTISTTMMNEFNRVYHRVISAHPENSLGELDPFIPSKNYEKNANLWQKSLKDYKTLNNALLNVDDATKTKINSKKELHEFVDHAKELIDKFAQIAGKSNEIINKQKEQLSEDITKTNNFKQYILAISYAAQYCFKMINTITKAVDHSIWNVGYKDDLKILDLGRGSIFTKKACVVYTKQLMENAKKYMHSEKSTVLIARFTLPIDPSTNTMTKELKTLMKSTTYQIPKGFVKRENMSLIEYLNEVFEESRQAIVFYCITDKDDIVPGIIIIADNISDDVYDLIKGS